MNRPHYPSLPNKIYLKHGFARQAELARRLGKSIVWLHMIVRRSGDDPPFQIAKDGRSLYIHLASFADYLQSRGASDLVPLIVDYARELAIETCD